MDLLRPRRAVAGSALLLAAFLLAALPGRAQEVLTEQEVKAAYLYNFTKFVEWPAGTFESPSSPLHVCVFGEDPFGKILDGLVREERAGAQKLVARRPNRLQDLRSCHVLFVSPSEGERLGEVLASVRKSNVLTVGEGEEFLKRGGMIAFVREKAKVRFIIGKQAVEQAPFKISSRLMALGDRRGNG